MKINDIGSKTHLDKTHSATVLKRGGKKMQQPSPEDVAKKQSDKVELSGDVKSRAKIAQYAEMVSKMPDVRSNEIDRVKKKLANSGYDSKKVYEKTAENILKETKE